MWLSFVLLGAICGQFQASPAADTLSPEPDALAAPRELAQPFLEPRPPAGAIAVQEAPLPETAPAPTSGTHTRVSFGRSHGQAPYSVRIANTELTCQAPCMLMVPNGKNAVVFQSGSSSVARKYTLAGDDLALELLKPRSTGKIVGGSILLGVGALGFIVGTIGLAAVCAVGSTDYGDSASDVFGGVILDVFFGMYGAVAVVAGYFVALVTGIPGAILLATSGPKIESFQGRAPDTLASVRDSLHFGIAPVRDGMVGALGFNF